MDKEWVVCKSGENCQWGMLECEHRKPHLSHVLCEDDGNIHDKWCGGEGKCRPTTEDWEA